MDLLKSTFLFIILILNSFVVPQVISDPSRTEYTRLQDMNDPNLQALAEFAIDEYLKTHPVTMKYHSMLSAYNRKTWYLLNFLTEAENSLCYGQYSASVHVKKDGSKRLHSFKELLRVNCFK